MKVLILIYAQIFMSKTSSTIKERKSEKTRYPKSECLFSIGHTFFFLPFFFPHDIDYLLYTDPLCGLACPDASYTSSEWRRLVILTQIGSSLSLICMAFLIASCMCLPPSYSSLFPPPLIFMNSLQQRYLPCRFSLFFLKIFFLFCFVFNFFFVIDLIKADKRRFPATTHLHEFVATALFAVSFLLGGTNPEKNVWCYDEGTYATQNNNATCAVQGKKKRNKKK